ncbi:MAG: phenylalanine--tRNA ligase subunit beta, partial [Clostridia bacterium]|nr:phenylalanine--tRNA ligase subunit beta [Clostridia bacterium]
ILTRLNFKAELNGDDLTVTCPLFREDMESYPDIAEEIIREYGYDNIVPILLKTSEITSGGLTDAQLKINAVKDLLTGYGFNEMISYSFVNEKEFDLYGIDKTNVVRILNPLSEDSAVMRKSVLPSVVRAVLYNLNRKNNQGRLFELAKVYIPKELPLKELPVEEERLAFAVFGDNEDFFTLKGVVEGLINITCASDNVKYQPSTAKYLHPTRSADLIINGTVYGSFGQLDPVLSEQLGIDKPVYVCEINYCKLTEQFNDKVMFKAISKFPTVERDLAVVVDDNITCQQIIDVIKESGGEFLENVSIFDVYKGVNIPENKKSMAYNLIFSSLDRTLNVEEIDQAVKNILENLSSKLNAELR